MVSSYRDHPAKQRRLLGGQRAKRFHLGHIVGPEFYNWLAAQAAERIDRSRGRPSADWDMRRLFPVRRVNWDRLKHFARRLGLSPGPLAALLVENGLDRLANDPSRAS